MSASNVLAPRCTLAGLSRLLPLLLMPLMLPADMVLVWADEFNQADGTPPNPAYWNYDIGGGGWGNGESQYYTNSTDNARIENGQLVIELRRDLANAYPNNAYTSARLLTRGKLDWKYGRIEARIKVPDGAAGLWPAFWMLGSNIGQVGWPRCGEIDIMEYISRKPDEIFGTIHGPGYSGGNAYGNILQFGGPVAAEFHTYAVEWEPFRIRWYVDGFLYHTATPADVAPNEWVFEQNFFIILNLAIGGNFGGAISPSITYPQRMLVDYVRVYQGDTVLPAIDIPARVQAEAYTAQYGVRFETTTDVGGGLNAGYLADGDYLEYALNSAAAGTYAITARVASNASITGRIRVSANGQSVTSGAITNTGGWQSWTTIPVGEIHLPEGLVTLRVTIESPGPDQDAFNLNWLDILPTELPERLILTQAGSFNDENGDGFADVGETIHYTFVVANTGTVPLSPVTVTAPVVTVNSTPAAPANLLDNEGFEGSAAGVAPGSWELSLGGGSATVSTAHAHSGMRSLAINSAGAGGWSSPNASQSFSASAGDEFTFSGHLLTPSTITDGSFGLLKMEFRNSAGTVLNPAAVSIGTAASSPYFGAESTPFLNSVSPAGSWTFSQVQAVAPATTTTVSFYLMNVNPPGASRVMFFDSIQATRVGAGGGPLTLNAGETDSTTFTGTYTITEADINAGRVAHTATATADQSSPAFAEAVTLLRADPTADPDGDGFINFLERAYGLDLFTRDSPAKGPTAGAMEVAGETYLTLTFRRRAGGTGETAISYTADGYTYVVEVSPTLAPGTWLSGASIIEAVGSPVDHGDGTETVTVRTVSPISTGNLFVRLRIEESP